MLSFGRCLRDKRGATTIEYALICLLIVIGIIAACILIGEAITPPLDTASQAMVPQNR